MDTVAVLGPVGTFTDEAARRYFGSSKFIYCNSVTEVFDMVERDVEYGVIPIENSTEGSVGETIDCLRKYDLYIWGEVYHHIVHVLAGTGRLEDVKTIMTHPQAISQCRNKVEKLLKSMPQVVTKGPTGKVLSTARAMEMVAQEKDPTIAVIGSKNAAQKYGLNIIAENLSDQDDNETRFFVISKKQHQKTGKDKTSIITAVKDEAGALWKLLGIFAREGINLTKIESRPRRERKWEYLFFIDFEGHKDDGKVENMLESIKESSTYFKLLGSYPRWA
ncbi:MAG: prephenate dehydratase [Candidatus Altiarchaeota archaeon]|nr:prephenate dehydratase [Candidatus Altiarchaeota archaeon]